MKNLNLQLILVGIISPEQSQVILASGSKWVSCGLHGVLNAYVQLTSPIESQSAQGNSHFSIFIASTRPDTLFRADLSVCMYVCI